MRTNVRIFLTSLLVSLPLWVGVNIVSEDLTEFFYWRELGSNPELLAAQASLKQLEKQVFDARPTLKIQTQPLDIQAKAFLSVFLDENGETKQLAQKDSRVPLPIASITKLMTALTTIEEYDIEQRIQITKETLGVEGKSGNFLLGNVFTVQDLLYPLLMESSNDAAVALSSLARQEGFVDLMNLNAERLQLSQTFFSNPTGLDPEEPGDPVSYSTAQDVATLGIYLLRNRPEIFDILSQKEFALYTPDNQFHHTIFNTNILLNDTEWQTKIIGGKTGWTILARGTLLHVVQGPRGGVIINILLGSEDRFADMKILLSWVYESYIW
ncbi:D-alanyl-D-alanine carboxypeptidase [Patescibacteria group bacterium]|nr:D-alanyl-D-alanine carboxypeptidase [Patescibacteria group bacterium]